MTEKLLTGTLSLNTTQHYYMYLIRIDGVSMFLSHYSSHRHWLSVGYHSYGKDIRYVSSDPFKCWSSWYRQPELNIVYNLCLFFSCVSPLLFWFYLCLFEVQSNVLLDVLWKARCTATQNSKMTRAILHRALYGKKHIPNARTGYINVLWHFKTQHFTSCAFFIELGWRYKLNYVAFYISKP